MTAYFYHASHEQFSPRQLLDLAQRAEVAGFDGVFSSDHLQPWSPSQAHSGFSWSWLGAALARTRRISFATITVPGGWRYHPAVLAQAAATLAEMFPERLRWIAVGSGEALNEAMLGASWPPKQERNARLQRGAAMLADLLAGGEVSSIDLPTAKAARIWVRPGRLIPVVGAALTKETAAWLGGWADGLLTAGVDNHALISTVNAFRSAGGSDKPIQLKVDVCLAATESAARDEAHRNWRYALVPGSAKAELTQPEEFEKAAERVTIGDVASQVITGSDPLYFVEELAKLAAIGFETIDIHNVGVNQVEFIDIFGREVLPRLRHITTPTDGS